jgi:hypothetical protein
MFPSPFRVVLDACVLYPLPLCDTLLRAAAAGLFQLYWTEEILDEAHRNLVDRIGAPRADKRLAAMRLAFDESMVTDYEALIPSMPNHSEDRHVTAAAVRCGAQVVVTANIRDFASMPDGIEALSPDDFLGDLFDLAPATIIQILREQADALREPPMSFSELLQRLAKAAPAFAEAVRQATGS